MSRNLIQQKNLPTSFPLARHNTQKMMLQWNKQSVPYSPTVEITQLLMGALDMLTGIGILQIRIQKSFLYKKLTDLESGLWSKILNGSNITHLTGSGTGTMPLTNLNCTPGCHLQWPAKCQIPRPTVLRIRIVFYIKYRYLRLSCYWILFGLDPDPYRYRFWPGSEFESVSKFGLDPKPLRIISEPGSGSVSNDTDPQHCRPMT